MKPYSFSDPTMFDSSLSNLTESIKDFYDPETCESRRLEQADGAAQWKGTHIVRALFDNQEMLVKAWTSQASGGKEYLKLAIGEDKWKQLNLEDCFAPKIVATGPFWQCANINDYMFGKTVVLLDGDEHFVAGISLAYFHAHVTKGNKNMTDCSNILCNMTREELQKDGGFYVLLKKGQGITIPPGYLFFHRNCGGMGFSQEKEYEGSDLLVS